MLLHWRKIKGEQTVRELPLSFRAPGGAEQKHVLWSCRGAFTVPLQVLPRLLQGTFIIRKPNFCPEEARFWSCAVLPLVAGYTWSAALWNSCYPKEDLLLNRTIHCDFFCDGSLFHELFKWTQSSENEQFQLYCSSPSTPRSVHVALNCAGRRPHTFFAVTNGYENKNSKFMFPWGPDISAAGSKAHAVSHSVP